MKSDSGVAVDVRWYQKLTFLKLPQTDVFFVTQPLKEMMYTDLMALICKKVQSVNKYNPLLNAGGYLEHKFVNLW